MWNNVINAIPNMFDSLFGLIGDVVTDDQKREAIQKELQEIKANVSGTVSELHKRYLQSVDNARELQASIAKKEIDKGGIAAIWRPITMLSFVFIILHNTVLYPYLSVYFDQMPQLLISDKDKELMEYSMIIYIGGRSVEKSISTIANKILSR